MSNHAAAIIYTRMKHIGFPQSLMIQPEDYTPDEAKNMLDYIHDAMRNDIELRSAHLCSRIVIADDRHVVLGGVCFLRDLVKGAWSTTDNGRREIHGFVGFAWRREDFDANGVFPSDASLLAALEKWAHPHWEEPDHALWAEFPHLSAYEEAVEADALPSGVAAPNVAASRGRTAWIFSAETEADAVAWALEQASQGKRLSLCTNRYIYSDQDKETLFQYAVQMRRAAETPTSPAPRPVKPPEPAADVREDDNPRTLSGGSKPKRTPPRPDVVPAMKKTDAPPRREAPGSDAALGAVSGIAGLVLLILAIVQHTTGWVDGKWKALIAVMILVAAALIALSALILRRAGKKLEKQRYITMPIAGSPSCPEGTNGQKEAPKRSADNPSRSKETIEDIYRM